MNNITIKKQNSKVKKGATGAAKDYINDPYYGGAQSDIHNYPGGGVSANRIRGVRLGNRLGMLYHWAANMMFGWLHKYTGL